MSKLYGGIETGGTWTVCMMGGGPDEIGACEQFPTGSPDQTLSRVIEFFRSQPELPVAVGVGSFGPIDADARSRTWGYVTTTPKPGWQHTAVGPVLREALGVPVAFDLDVTAAAVGEHRWGAGRGLRSLCYLTVGTGIGAGLVVGGEPVRGLVHPEVGHIRIPLQDDFAGVCPAHGNCWEGLASGGAISDRWGMSAADLPDDHPAWALEAEYLALGILSIVFIASPERVIAGGGVMERAALLPLVRARLRELNAGYLDTPMLDSRVDDYLVPPALGDRAGVLGAVALAQMIE